MQSKNASPPAKKKGLLGRFKKTKPESEDVKKPISLYGPTRPAPKAAPVVKNASAPLPARRPPLAQPRALPPQPASTSTPAPPRAADPVSRRQARPPPPPRPVRAHAQQRSSAQAPPPPARRRPSIGVRQTVPVPVHAATAPPPLAPPKSAPSTATSRALPPAPRAAHPKRARQSISDKTRGANQKPLQDPNQIRANRSNVSGSVHAVSAIAPKADNKNKVEQAEQEPAPIEGSAGSRVRVVLGGRGSDFLLLLEEEDGTRTWQSKHWSGNGSIPAGLEAQLRKVDLVHQCSFSTADWFLSARETATGQTKSWWQVRNAEFHRALQAAIQSGLQVRVVFGDPSQHQYIILLGPNGYTLGPNLPPQLLDSLDKVYEAESTIARIRGLNGNGRFLLEETVVEDEEGGDDDEDEEGIVRTCYHSNGLSPYLTEALKQSLEDDSSDLHEIGMAILDKSWLIIRDDAHESSVGVNDELIQLLDAFYQRHKERQEAREHEIALFREKKQRPSGPPGDSAAAEARREKQKEEAAVAEARRLAHKKHVEEIWVTAHKRRGKEDRITEISTKGLKKDDQVTVLGLSLAPGDATVVDINRQEGYVVVSRESDKEKGRMPETIVQDPRRISIHKANAGEFDERNELFQLAVAEDKFEAAIVMHHSHIKSNTCSCKKDLIGYSQRFMWPNPWQPGDEVHVTGFANGIVIASDPKYAHNPYLVHVQYEDGSSYHVSADRVRAVNCCMSPECCEFQMATRESDEIALRIRPLFERMEPNPDVVIFDEYKCAEKIDLRRLQRLADNLRLDCAERRNCMNEIVELLDDYPEDNWEYEEYFRKLERCYDFEETVFTFYDLFKGQPVDDHGFLVHQVQYRHKDASCRGRLFALGSPVRVLEEKFPRTLTLQGVQAELWPPLAGAFAYNIDCENSDIRLLCSLAKQLGLESTIPSISDFCNNRSVWLDAIQQEHPTIPAQEIKRLPNIILCGGTYETWVKEVGAVYPVTKVSRFGFRILLEVKTFCDQVMRHPRFQWIERERDVLEKESVVGEAANVVLFMRILQACENEVLGILHRTFHNHGCQVRSKVFDGLLVELGLEAIDAGTTLEDIMDRAEKACEAQGWDIHLVEKPLHGLQDYAIPCVEEAREVVEAWLACRSQDSDKTSSASQDEQCEASIEESETEEEEADGTGSNGKEKSANGQARERLSSDGPTRDASQAQQNSDSSEVDESTSADSSSIDDYSEVTATEYTEAAATLVSEYTELTVQSDDELLLNHL